MNFQGLPGNIDLNTWMWHSVFNRAGGVQPKVGLSLGGFFPALMTPYHTLYWERSKRFKEWCNFIKIISGVTPGLVQQLCSNSDHHRHTTTQQVLNSSHGIHWDQCCKCSLHKLKLWGIRYKKSFSLIEHTWIRLGHFLFMQIYWGSSNVSKAAKLKSYKSPKSHWYWLSVTNKITG